MGIFRYLLVIAIAALLALGCVYGFFRLSRDDGKDGDAPFAAAMSAVEDSGGETPGEEPLAAEEEETAEVKQWVKVTFDAVVIAMTCGVAVLAFWAVKRVMKRYGNPGRRFR